jgi:hypothetical protein
MVGVLRDAALDAVVTIEFRDVAGVEDNELAVVVGDTVDEAGIITATVTVSELLAKRRGEPPASCKRRNPEAMLTVTTT